LSTNLLDKFELHKKLPTNLSYIDINILHFEEVPFELWSRAAVEEISNIIID
jgi:hypothetical protein